MTERSRRPDDVRTETATDPGPTEPGAVEPASDESASIESDPVESDPVESVPFESAGGTPGVTDAARGGRRPSPGPSPTSRARRVAAAGVEARRPSPGTGDRGMAAAARPAATRSSEAVSPEAVPATDLPARDAPTPGEPVAELTPAGHRAPLWLAVLLGLLVLAGVAAVVLAANLPAKSGSSGERDRALAAAKTEVPLILSYNYASFDADVAKAKAELTGRAVTDYSTAMSQTIKPAAVKVKAVVQAQTDGAGVESVSPDGRQVTVVVFGEQKVTNTSLSAPRTDLFRVRATLDLVGGNWLVSKFDQI